MKPQELYDILTENKIDCFCGVPDSLLKDFCAYITDNSGNHTITANEGNAIGLAAGHYLATGNPAVVYMQNSGIGNCVNPLLSLTDEEVYNIPLLMFIGWRGEPDKHDEPQHIKQGKVTDKLLEAMGIKYEILPQDFETAKPVIQNAINYMKETKKPFAFIVKKGLFEKYTLKNKKDNGYSLRREEAIETVIKALKTTDVVVSTTGHISREVYETRERLGQSHKQDFLTVGSMGHSSSIALGIALEKPDRNVFCFDGDGAFLMHMGSCVVNASKNLKNFKHIVFNNEAHDSVGSQPTAVDVANIPDIAKASGYKKVFSVKTKEELKNILPEFINQNYPVLLEIKVKCGAREDLGRPKEKPVENKKIFTENLKQISFIGKGAVENLSKIVKEESYHKILAFTGKKSFEKIKPIFEKELQSCKIQYFSDFSPNPKKEEVDNAIKNINPDFDVIIAVGGGSVMDFAKAYKFYTKSEKKIIAIPTTFGTGSEATQISVIYINGEKNSLDDKTLLPDFAIVDSNFAKGSSKYLKASTAMDTYCQAIESYWAVKSTELSREYAKEAIILCRDNLEKYVNSDDDEAAEKMAKASHLAGKAINISRTTAAHALSYKFTTLYNIPHGHAVCLSMADLFKANSEVSAENCNDKRGCDFVKEKIGEILEMLELSTPHDFCDYWYNLTEKTGLQCNFEKLGIKDKKEIINAVNLERLKNNPKNLSEDFINFWKQ